jgi:biopolymer transport protein ExbD
MQDTSTNAMTEVALGLSMAFFSLLILALLSISMPPSAQQQKKQALQQAAVLKIEQDQQGQGDDRSQFVFYFNGNFYDQTPTLRIIESFSSDQPLILAIDKKMTFSQVFNLRQQINHPNLSITTLNEEWLQQLEQM